MTIEDIVTSEGLWKFSGKDNEGIVLKSTVIMRRNIDGKNFMRKLPKNKEVKLFEEIKEAIFSEDFCVEYTQFGLENIKKLDKKVFEERDILKENSEARELIISNDEKNYFILGSDDHLILFVNNPGNSFEDIRLFGEQVLYDLGKVLRFSFRPEFGYLTANPNYAGPGFQMVMTCHLAGLSTTGVINELISDLKKDGFKIKGSWINDFYSIYKSTTLGFTERQLYKRSINIFEKVVKKEREAREKIYSVNRESIEDRVWRSIGILKSARLMTLFEAMDLISKVRFGLSMGIIDKPSLKDLNKLLYYIQDAHLIKRFKLSDDYYKDQDFELIVNENRANLIRNYLKEVA